MATNRWIQIIGIAGALAGCAAAAEQQSFTIAAPLGHVTAPTSGTLSRMEAGALADAVLGEEADHRASMIHVVRYQSISVTPQTQHWYMYDPADNHWTHWFQDYHAKKRYQDARVFGQKNVALVYLHIFDALSFDAAGAQLRMNDMLVPSPGTLTLSQMEMEIKADVEEIRSKQPNNPRITSFVVDASRTPDQTRTAWITLETERRIVELMDTGKSDMFVLTSANGAKLNKWNGYFIEDGFQKLSTLTYSITVTKKEPSPLVNLQQIGGLAFGAQSETVNIQLTLQPTAFAAGGTIDAIYVPSDVAVSATYMNGDKSADLGKQTYDNEARYMYDFSLAVPINTYSDLTYDSTSAGLTVRQIKKVNVWGVFNFGVRRDTKKPTLQLIPTLMYGLPISGRPLKHDMFAGSVGLNKVNFFFGVRLDEKNFYHNFAQPLRGDNVFHAWRTHKIYGINFPVDTIVQALKKKS